MKPSQKILLFTLLIVFGAGCKKDNEVDPTTNCRLTGFTGSFYAPDASGQFEYDANGHVIREFRDFDFEGKANYRYTYDASGQLSRSDYEGFDPDGKKLYEGFDNYTWANGRLVKSTFDGGVNNLKYNAAGQLIEYTYELVDPTNNAKWQYEYDANKVLIHRLLTSFDGKEVIFEEKLTYTTKEVVQTGFVLMPKAGLPFDIALARAWESYVPKNDGTYEAYLVDQNGKLELVRKATIKDMTFNKSGLAIGWNFVDNKGVKSPIGFPVTGCE